MTITTTSEKGVRSSIGNARDNLTHLVSHASAYALPIATMERLVALAEKTTWSLASDVQWLHQTRAAHDSDYAAKMADDAEKSKKAAVDTEINLRAAYLDIMLDEALASLERLERG